MKDNNDLLSKIERLYNALEFYSMRGNYKAISHNGYEDYSAIEKDRGEIAIKSLEIEDVKDTILNMVKIKEEIENLIYEMHQDMFFSNNKVSAEYVALRLEDTLENCGYDVDRSKTINVRNNMKININ